MGEARRARRTGAQTPAVAPRAFTWVPRRSSFLPQAFVSTRQDGFRIPRDTKPMLEVPLAAITRVRVRWRWRARDVGLPARPPLGAPRPLSRARSILLSTTARRTMRIDSNCVEVEPLYADVALNLFALSFTNCSSPLSPSSSVAP
jgi:hypothetical protein